MEVCAEEERVRLARSQAVRRRRRARALLLRSVIDVSSVRQFVAQAIGNNEWEG